MPYIVETAFWSLGVQIRYSLTSAPKLATSTIAQSGGASYVALMRQGIASKAVIVHAGEKTSGRVLASIKSESAKLQQVNQLVN